MDTYRLALVTIAVSVLIGCSDTVTSRYETRAEAESDRLFERGWLPEFIPPSSRRIVTRNDLDRNVSNGEFFFSSNDLKDFLSRLNRREDLDSGLFRGYSFDDWVFLVDSENCHCTYSLRPHRER